MKKANQLAQSKQMIINIFAFVLIVLVSFNSKAQTYCNPTWQYNADGNMITKVVFGTIDQTSPFTSGTTPSYEDFTSQTTTVDAGNTYPISIKGPSSTFPSDVVVFVDFNQNGSFDDLGESFYIGRLQSANPANAFTITGDIVIPTGALAGNTRMRILKNTNLAALSDPAAANLITTACGAYRAGQVEDYTLNVLQQNQVQEVQITTLNNVPATISVLNGTLQLSATILPVATSLQDVSWTIESGNAVTIDQSGLVTALSNGTVTVRATSVEDNTKFDEIVVTINYPVVIEIEEVVVSVFNNASPEITVLNGTLQLLASVNPSQVSQDVTWSITSGNTFLSINQNGVVTAFANGTATVRATSVEDNTKFDELEVKVNISFVGVEKLSNTISIYPNPTTDFVHVSVGGQVVVAIVYVFDADGREVLQYEFDTSNFKVDLSFLPSGSYRLMVETNRGIISNKIIKL